ncbi:exosortase F system-associated membrane protein [Mesonia maritima]|uniref:Exosortase F-associated protein n=1 Tax=Mesonia maritima TaxID=1793873 RepID=A0ABU1K8P2_9FLAO|nr:exosortase F system-associated protein [Mesonia maritima]MDR6301964.1 exosortase F-associated protein [Mesonia maritima]
MNKWVKIVLVFCLFFLLVLIRFFEKDLFYDPLLTFYKGNYQYQSPPEMENFKLILNTFFRYLLNSGVSLLVLYVAFQKKAIIKFSLIFYCFIGALLMLFFSYLIFNFGKENYFLMFYVRRFLIQPLFILLLLPAFYYQYYIKKSR